MNYADSSPGFSGTFNRSKSIETGTYSTSSTAPTLSSTQIGHSDTQFSPTGQRSVPADPPAGLAPVQGDIRQPVNSSNQITDREWDGKPQSFSDLGRNNDSGYGVDVSTEERPPTQSDFANRERSNNGASESINPLDYAGISLVGKKFKLVNPEAYYVEKDDPYN